MKPTKEDFLNAVAKSIEHHTDGMTRTKKDYYDFPMGSEKCGLCNLFCLMGINDLTCRYCCPLYQKKEKDCAEEYLRALSARDENNYPAFIEAETALVERLKTMLCPDFYDTYYGKEKEEKVPDFAPYVQRKEGHYYYYMGVWSNGLTLAILTYDIPAKRTNIFQMPSNISDFFLGYMFGNKVIGTFRSEENINTIAEQFTSYCESLERSKTKK